MSSPTDQKPLLYLQSDDEFAQNIIWLLSQKVGQLDLWDWEFTYS